MKFLFVGSAAYSNRGCEAIVRGTVEILSQQFPGARYIISSTPDEDPADARTEIDYRIERMPPQRNSWELLGARRLSDPRWWLYRIALRPFPIVCNRYLHKVELKAMQQASCALQVGGDNYTFDYGAPQWLICLDQALLSSKKPLILWGASIGPFNTNRRIESLMKRHLSRFHLICVRETESLAYLHSLGISHNVKLVADPAFLMQPQRPELPPQLEECLCKHPIGLNLSAFSGKFTKARQHAQAMGAYGFSMVVWEECNYVIIYH